MKGSEQRLVDIWMERRSGLLFPSTSVTTTGKWRTASSCSMISSKLYEAVVKAISLAASFQYTTLTDGTPNI